MERNKFKRSNPDGAIMKKAGADAQEWFSKKVILELRAGKVLNLPVDAPNYITNIEKTDSAETKDLSSSIRAQKEKKTETFKEVKTDVKEEVASTPKKESGKPILNKK